jgi:hypothetical protein
MWWTFVCQELNGTPCHNSKYSAVASSSSQHTCAWKSVKLDGKSIPAEYMISYAAWKQNPKAEHIWQKNRVLKHFIPTNIFKIYFHKKLSRHRLPFDFPAVIVYECLLIGSQSGLCEKHYFQEYKTHTRFVTDQVSVSLLEATVTNLGYHDWDLPDFTHPRANAGTIHWLKFPRLDLFWARRI